MKFRGRSRPLLLVIAGIVLALLLPTPLFLLVAGGWLGWKGSERFKKKSQSDSPSRDPLP